MISMKRQGRLVALVIPMREVAFIREGSGVGPFSRWIGPVWTEVPSISPVMARAWVSLPGPSLR